MDWCWSWSSSTLATWCAELTHWERPWRWERLKAGGEGDARGCHPMMSWMASLTWWTWVWASPGSWWWTWKLGVLPSTGSQRVAHNWTELTRSWPPEWQDPAPGGQAPVPTTRKPAQTSGPMSATRGQTCEAREAMILRPKERRRNSKLVEGKK